MRPNDPSGSYEARTVLEPDVLPSPVRHPRTAADALRRLGSAIVALGLLALKFGWAFVKFFSIFIAVGGYALIWGWKFAAGFVLLILIHELGHFFEARRQGLRPSLPVFIPFLGAYVAIKGMPFNPWRNVLVSMAGPLVGGLGALGMLVAGEVTDSDMLRALGYTGFLLNLFNLLPLGPLDGGQTWRAIKVLRHGGGAATAELARRKAWLATALYLGIALALVGGMVVAHVPQSRL
jgi:Zn-dependent protease